MRRPCAGSSARRTSARATVCDSMPRTDAGSSFEMGASSRSPSRGSWRGPISSEGRTLVKAANGHVRECVLELPFDAVVEDARVRVGTERGHHQEVPHAADQRRARERQRVVVVDTAEGLPRSGLLDGAAETADGHVAARIGKRRLEPLEVDQPLLEPWTDRARRPARDRQHTRHARVLEQAAQRLAAHQPRRSGQPHVPRVLHAVIEAEAADRCIRERGGRPHPSSRRAARRRRRTR